ncbi:hypothetical protein DBV39_03020 [Orrella marina]|uniref:Uncharacterized protein n=1 Tax=Orrella marina TaxID=2163011 RepID=A0A2R4XGA8_9BURK|nr:hypothetical protein DBV39_03020 [Orrella marina]
MYGFVQRHFVRTIFRILKQVFVETNGLLFVTSALICACMSSWHGLSRTLTQLRHDWQNSLAEK